MPLETLAEASATSGRDDENARVNQGERLQKKTSRFSSDEDEELIERPRDLLGKIVLSPTDALICNHWSSSEEEADLDASFADADDAGQNT